MAVVCQDSLTEQSQQTGVPRQSQTSGDQFAGVRTRFPIIVGGVITIWCNGLGPVSGEVASGDIPGEGSLLLETTKSIKLLIGGVEAEIIGKPVLHPTLVGLNQMNAFVPEVPAGNEVSIQIEVDCGDGTILRSRADVTIAVGPAHP